MLENVLVGKALEKVFWTLLNLGDECAAINHVCLELVSVSCVQNSEVSKFLEMAKQSGVEAGFNTLTLSCLGSLLLMSKIVWH